MLELRLEWCVGGCMMMLGQYARDQTGACCEELPWQDRWGPSRCLAREGRMKTDCRCMKVAAEQRAGQRAAMHVRDQTAECFEKMSSEVTLQGWC